MAAGKILVLIGALLSIVGTFVFALYLESGIVGSGIGFALNIPTLIEFADFIAFLAGLEVFIIYIVMVVFIIFLAAGFLQLVGLKSRVVGLIFSLFPLFIGVMFILLFFTDIFGPISALFGAFFGNDTFGSAFPVFVAGGATHAGLGDFGIGAYLLVGGGALGLIGCILPRD